MVYEFTGESSKKYIKINTVTGIDNMHLVYSHKSSGAAKFITDIALDYTVYDTTDDTNGLQKQDCGDSSLKCKFEKPPENTAIIIDYPHTDRKSYPDYFDAKINDQDVDWSTVIIIAVIFGLITLACLGICALFSKKLFKLIFKPFKKLYKLIFKSSSSSSFSTSSPSTSSSSSEPPVEKDVQLVTMETPAGGTPSAIMETPATPTGPAAYAGEGPEGAVPTAPPPDFSVAVDPSAPVADPSAVDPVAVDPSASVAVDPSAPVAVDPSAPVAVDPSDPSVEI